MYVWQKSANDVLRRRTVQGNLVYRSEPSETLDAAWELGSLILRAFRDEVESDGGRFVLAVLPSGAQVYDDVWNEVLAAAKADGSTLDRDYPDRRLASIARDEELAVVTMTAAFRNAAGDRTAEETPEDDLLFFRGQGHFTARGNAVAANEIHRFLVNETLGEAFPR